LQYNIIDIVILIPIIFGFIHGLLRGLVREIISIVAIGVGIIASKLFAPKFAPLLMSAINMPDWLAKTLTYVIIFVGISLLCQVLGKLLRKFLKSVSLGWFDKLLGAIFGAFKWALLVSVVLNVLLLIDPYYEVFQPAAKQSSKCYEPTLKIAHITWDKANDLLPVAREQLEQPRE